MTPWIKIRADIFEDPRVLQLSDICRTEVEHTVGLLVRFWSWADRHTADGTGLRITCARLDRLVAWEGFGAGLLEIGWLEGTEGDYTIPRFLRHNGESAKARALEAEAKEIRRAIKKLSDKCPTNPPAEVRPEKRREEKSITHTLPAGAPEAEAVIDEGREGPAIPRPGFPEKAAALAYGTAQGWPVQSVSLWWLDRDAKASTGEARFRDPNFHWWSDLERWVIRDAALGGPAIPAGHRAAGSAPKVTINDFDRREHWTPEQMSLLPADHPATSPS